MVNVRCLRLIKQKIKNGIDVISNPPYVIKEFHIGERNGPEQWRYDHRKAGDATEGSKKNTMSPLNRCGSPIFHPKNRNCCTIGLLLSASTSTTSKPSTWTTLLLGVKEIDTRTCSSFGTKTKRLWQDVNVRWFQTCSLIICWPVTRKEKIFLQTSRLTISTATIECTT